MGKHWRIRPHDSERISDLVRATGVPAVVAQMLLCRGIADPNQVSDFLDTKLSLLRDPDELPGIPFAAELIFAAIESKKRIVIYGDYDADGMTGTAILYRCLDLLRADVGYYVPNRMEEGYGLNSDALEKLASRNTDMVITVDCGITSCKQAQTARRLGLDLIITDHHEMAESLPEATAIVHPRLPDHSYPFGELCGAGVAFKLAWALCQKASRAKKVSPPMKRFLLSATGLAAIGTVADMVPLVDENRVLVRHGLQSLKQNAPLGLIQLMKTTKLDGKPEINSEDIGFLLAPRINAAGRLGQAQLAIELMVTESEDRARALADYIHQLNESRTSLERSVYLSAHKQAKEKFDPFNDPGLVLADRDWHPGVIGIVAGRLAEKYSRPVTLIALDPLGNEPGNGSARSAGMANLHEVLNACTSSLITHGGHAAAAGLKIEECQIDDFRTSFCEYLSEESSDKNNVAELLLDAETSLSQLTLQAVKQIEQLSPFGQGNPRPTLCARGVSLAGEPRKMGGGNRHLALQIRQHNVSFRAVAFGQGEWAEELSQVSGQFDIAFRPVINTFAGRHSVELQLIDWRVNQAPTIV